MHWTLSRYYVTEYTDHHIVCQPILCDRVHWSPPCLSADIMWQSTLITTLFVSRYYVTGTLITTLFVSRYYVTEYTVHHIVCQPILCDRVHWSPHCLSAYLRSNVCWNLRRLSYDFKVSSITGFIFLYVIVNLRGFKRVCFFRERGNFNMWRNQRLDS